MSTLIGRLFFHAINNAIAQKNIVKYNEKELKKMYNVIYNEI